MPPNVGETLIYKASFSGIHAASASLKVIKKTVIEKDSVYHVQFKAKTKSAFNYVFPIDDKIDIWSKTKKDKPTNSLENTENINTNKNTQIKKRNIKITNKSH